MTGGCKDLANFRIMIFSYYLILVPILLTATNLGLSTVGIFLLLVSFLITVISHTSKCFRQRGKLVTVLPICRWS